MPADRDQFDFFVSYSRNDNANGWISRFIKELIAEHRKFSGGRSLSCFFDTEANRSFDDWQHRIYAGLAASNLFLAFISPNYFAGEWCRREWRTWIDVEIAKHILSGGVAPIYIIEVPGLLGESGKPVWSEQEVAQQITELCGLPGPHQEFFESVTPVVKQLRRRQFTAVQSFFTAGVEALRQADLRRVLETLAKELDARTERVRQAAESETTVPPYNKKFVGRLDELALLRERLHQGRTGVISGHKGDLPEDKTTIASVHGLGGIGKTELAFTYAHAFAGLYPGGRFLVPCDGRSDLRLAMLALDEIFRDQISDEQRKSLDLHFGTIRDCLRQRVGELGRILLVLDNVTDAALLSPEQTDHLRLLGSDLHLLATTRLGAPEGGGTYDDVHWLTLGELTFEDSMRLLEKHRPFATPAEHAAAERIARRLGGFALCVEVVGAYLGQHPEQSYAGYLETMGLQDLEPVDVTAERRDVSTRRHNNEKRLSAILAPTLASLPTEAVTALEFSALLPPDHIVLPWVRQLVGGKHPTDADGTDLWPRLVARLVSLGLLTRGQDGDEQALDESHQPRLFRCHRLLQDFMRGRLTADAKAAHQHAVDALVHERDAALKPTTRWKEACWELEPLTALAGVWDEAQHPEAGWLLNQAGQLWKYLAEWSRAEPLIRRALAVAEQSFGPEHPHFAISLDNLAGLLQATNRLAEAEPLRRRALAILEMSLGDNHPNFATSLNNLAQLLQDTNRPAEAEPLLRRALAIDEQSYGRDHPSVAIQLNNLARLLQDTNRLAEVEPLLRRALAIDERSFGPEHPAVARNLTTLAGFLQDTNRLAEAEPLLRRALAIEQKSLGEDHPSYATTLNALARLLQATNRLNEAERLFQQVIAIYVKSFGPEHPCVATALSNLAALLHDTNRLAEAEPLKRRALAIDEQSFGPEHPNVAIRLNNLAQLLQATNRLAEAEPLMRRGLAIEEKSRGEDHPFVAIQLNNLARLLQDANRPAEAEPLLQRALAIDKQSYGRDHPSVAIRLNNLAQLLQATNRLAEAEPLMRRVVEIFLKFMQATGHQHPQLQPVINNYAALLRAMGLSEPSVFAKLNEVAAPFGIQLGG